MAAAPDQCDPYMMDGMTTYSIREAKARLSEIVRDLERGGEVIITRRGWPCGRLTAVDAGGADRPSLAMLRGALSQLPDAGTRTPGTSRASGRPGSNCLTGSPGTPMVSRTRFVVDPHALWWYFRSPERLSVAASAVFQLAEIGNAAVAEFHHLSVKLGSPLAASGRVSSVW